MGNFAIIEGMIKISAICRRACVWGCALVSSFLIWAPTASAQIFFGRPIYRGGGVQEGVGAAALIRGVAIGNLRQQIGNLVNTALNFAALIAVTVIIIAGFYLLFSLGDEQKITTARKIIIYTAVGLLVLVLAKVIVAFFILLPQ